MTTRLGETWRSLRFLQLFVFTVLVLLLIPIQLRFRALGLVLILLYLNAVAVSLSAAGYRGLRWPFLAGWVLIAILKPASIADPGLSTVFYVTSRALVVVLLGACVAAVMGYVLRHAVISVDRIFAAIVAYMLAALAFAAAYEAVVAVAPESFALPASISPVDVPERLEVQLIYYSFVTIATLGYGDISPRQPLAQMLSVLEAVVGQFYVAVVIAWLVSLYAAQHKAST